MRRGPRRWRRRSIHYRGIQSGRLSPFLSKRLPALAEDVEEHDISGVVVRVYGAAKTVADCFKFRNKIGIDVAVEALRSYRKTFRKGLEPLWKFAEMDCVARVIRPYPEAG
jgi:hypothetical protein